MAYASAADLQEYYDWREIGDLISDSGEQVSALDQVTAGNMYHTRLSRFLDRASGEVEAALLRGGRYTPTDLAGLTGNARELLRGIVCEFVVLYLFERKPLYKPDMLEQFRKAKTERLGLLASGTNIFGGLPAAAEAAKPAVDGPSLVTYTDYLNLVTDRVRGYPARALPGNR
jgi:hypothetical protein